jgi:serine/threonine-protein kinase
VVRDLDVGPHSVRVMTPTETGLEPLKVEIEAGKITPIAVTLKPQLGTFVAAAGQPGVHLFFDGIDKGELPVKLADLAPGKHDVKLTSDRHKTFEKQVEIKAGETLSLDLPKLTVTRGRVTVNVKSEGVNVVIIPNADPNRPKALDGPFPRAIEVDTASGTYKLVAKKKALPDFVQELDFSDGVAERTIDVVMKEETKPETTAPEPIALSSLPSTPTSTTAPRPPPGTAPVRPTADATPDPPPAAQGGMGTLNINSLPASRVLLDGSPLGETPKMGISVSAGTHTVTFIHPELGKKSMSIKVGAGETKTASARLRKD